MENPIHCFATSPKDVWGPVESGRGEARRCTVKNWWDDQDEKKQGKRIKNTEVGKRKEFPYIGPSG